MIAPGLAALVSADVFLAGSTLAYTGRNNIGVRREVGGSALPFALMFSRAGSAMVSTMAFIMVLRSFSGLEIGIARIVQVMIMSFGFSFLLPAVPAGGVLVLLSMLASGFSQGFEDAYLILRPVAPVLLAIAAYVDVMTAGAVMHIVAGRRKQRDLPDLSDMV
jgi:Na+/H+-dicarboxylate symporter